MTILINFEKCLSLALIELFQEGAMSRWSDVAWRTYNRSLLWAHLVGVTVVMLLFQVGCVRVQETPTGMAATENPGDTILNSDNSYCVP